MKSKQQQMISSFIKEGRLAKGFTQKELSELSNVSVRSIQRIENGDILPRSYTLKTLAEVLGLSIDNVLLTEPDKGRSYKLNPIQKIILSIGISLLIILLAWAFIAQSPRFPETTFELLMFSTAVLLGIVIILVFIWRSK